MIQLNGSIQDLVGNFQSKESFGFVSKPTLVNNNSKDYDEFMPKVKKAKKRSKKSGKREGSEDFRLPKIN